MTENKERTFIMIKPDGVQRNLVGKIIQRFEEKGFKLVAMKMVWVCILFFVVIMGHLLSKCRCNNMLCMNCMILCIQFLIFIKYFINFFPGT